MDDDGMNRLERRRLLRDVVGVEAGVVAVVAAVVVGTDADADAAAAFELLLALFEDEAVLECVSLIDEAADDGCCWGDWWCTLNLGGTLLLSMSRDNVCAEVPCDRVVVAVAAAALLPPPPPYLLLPHFGDGFGGVC